MAEDFGFKEDFGFQASESKDNFGFESSEKPIEKSKAQQFEEMPIGERVLKAPTAALETAVRGPLSFISGTVGKAVGTGLGALETGTVKGAVEKGQQFEEAASIDPRQAGSAYFDEQISKGLDWLKQKWSDLADEGKPITQQTYGDLKREAAKRSISEGLFDSLMVSFMRGKGQARPTEAPIGEPSIRPGPTGPQGEMFGEERVQPSIQDGQTVRSPYNIPVDEVDRLNRELNPPTEERRTGQGELFTDEAAYTKDELQARRFQMDQGGGGRFKTPDMDRQVTSDLYTQEGLGGATEQSNMSQDLF